MHIVSWNVNGLPTTLKEASYHHKSLERYFSEVLKADIVCFQEAKVREDRLEKWLACVPGYESFWAFSQNKKGYSGVVTYVKEAFSPLSAAADDLPVGGGGGGEDDITQEGRVMLTDHGAFVLLNVYAPNAGEKPLKPRLEFKMKFLNALRAKCDGLVANGRHVIIVGDLNVSHTEADIHSCFGLHKVYATEELAWTDSFLSEYVDAWRHFHPNASDGFTCWNQKKSARLFNEGARIDFTICDKAFQSQLVAADILDTPDKWSDHAAVSLTLRDQPRSAAHPAAALSSKRMKQFQEDRGQSKLTALFLKRKRGASEKGDVKEDGAEPREEGGEEDWGKRLKDEGGGIHPGVQGEAAEEKQGGEMGNGATLEAENVEKAKAVTIENWPAVRESVSEGASRERDKKANLLGDSLPSTVGLRNEEVVGEDDLSARHLGGADTNAKDALEEESGSGGVSSSRGHDACQVQNDVDELGRNSVSASKESVRPGTVASPLRKTMSGKKRVRNGIGSKPVGSETRMQMKLSSFYAKKQ